jgi:hypothetical protein
LEDAWSTGSPRGQYWLDGQRAMTCVSKEFMHAGHVCHPRGALPAPGLAGCPVGRGE